MRERFNFYKIIYVQGLNRQVKLLNSFEDNAVGTTTKQLFFAT